MISRKLHPLADPAICTKVHDAARSWRDRAQSRRGHDALPDQTVAELRHLDVMRLWQAPEVNWATICEISRLAAQACPSTGWVLVNCIGHALIADRFPDTLAKRIFSRNPATVIATAMAARDAKIIDHDDGSLTISGRFVNSSGIDHADWVLLKLPTGPNGQPRYVPCETSHISIERTWNASGLLASGTHGFSVELSVPKTEVADWEPCLKGDRPLDEVNGSYLRSMPMIAYLGTSLIAPILGCAEALFREHERLIVRRTKDIGLSSAPELTALGESAMELTTAQLLYRDLLDWLHDKGLRARTISTEEVKICRAKAATLVRLCGTAAKRLQDSCGMGVLSEDAPAQGYWRDLQVMSAHSDVRYGISLQNYGQVCLDAAKTTITETGSVQHDCA